MLPEIPACDKILSFPNIVGTHDVEGFYRLSHSDDVFMPQNYPHPGQKGRHFVCEQGCEMLLLLLLFSGLLLMPWRWCARGVLEGNEAEK